MSRKFWAVLSVLLIAILAVTACAPVPAQLPAEPAKATEVPAPAAAEPVTLTWAFWGSPEEAVSHKQVADAFMKEHPEIKIETWNAPWNDYFTKIQSLWASGDAKAVPDIAFLWPTPKYAAEGVLENLDPYIQKSGYDLNDYWGGLLESAKYQGSVYGLPRDNEVNILYYNKDLFDKAGVKYPDENWKWRRPAGRGREADREGRWRQGDAVCAGDGRRQVQQVGEPERRRHPGRLRQPVQVYAR